MYEALLIGFSYGGDLFLPGIIVDLYLAYQVCKKAGAHITILTDINEDERTEYLTKSIFNNIADADIVSFISRIKETGEHKYVTNREQIQGHLTRSFNGNPQRLFLYFTGHGVIVGEEEDNSLLLPSREMYSFYQLRSLLMSLPRVAEIVWINDCCHLSSMQLPYKLDPEEGYIYTDGPFCPLQKILFLGSTSVTEKSMISREGSVFSTLVFKYIFKGQDNLSALMKEVTSKLMEITEARTQRPVLYASYPTITHIFPWFLGHVIYPSEPDVLFVLPKNKKSLKWESNYRHPIEVSPLATESETSIVCWNDFDEIETI